MIAAPPAGAGSMSSSSYLERLKGLAAGFGVTRLADITGLDDAGLPVWQAIRPAGLSLSVHQGKGRTDEEARIGALSEAMESHCAERVEADGPVARFSQLPPAERAPRLCDYARCRERREPAGRIRWCRATNIVTSKPHYLPHSLVSLNFTRTREPWFERSSNGLGAGPGEDHALRTALCEVVERDAVGAWEREPVFCRIQTALPLDSVPFDWFQALRDRLETRGASIRLFAPAAAIGLPVVVCWIEGRERFGSRWRRFGGSGAHGDPGEALFRAVAEALQSRLTFIAAVRDDMLPSAYHGEQAPSALRLPPRPPGVAETHWDDLPAHRHTALAIVESLVRAGYGQVAVKRLDGRVDGLAVVKAFVPGLGSLTRRRAP